MVVLFIMTSGYLETVMEIEIDNSRSKEKKTKNSRSII